MVELEIPWQEGSPILSLDSLLTFPELLDYHGCDFQTGATRIIWVCCTLTCDRILPIRQTGGFAYPFCIIDQSCRNASVPTAYGSGLQLKMVGTWLVNLVATWIGLYNWFILPNSVSSLLGLTFSDSPSLLFDSAHPYYVTHAQKGSHHEYHKHTHIGWWRLKNSLVSPLCQDFERSMTPWIMATRLKHTDDHDTTRYLEHDEDAGEVHFY